MQTDKRKFAEEFASKYGWAQLMQDPSKMSVEFVWRIYADSIFKGKSISTAQYQETKQAFFIGFAECFKVMTDFAADLPEEQACDIFSKLAVETNGFITSLMDRTMP